MSIPEGRGVTPVEEVLGTTEKEWTDPYWRIERVAKLFGDQGSPTNLLDIGCGDGTVTGRIRKVLHLDLVDGVDLLADRVVPPSWLRLVKLDIDKEDLPYSDSSFEAIYCGELIEHVYDPDHLLDEIYRVLAPTGLCILTTPNLASWPNRLTLTMGFQPFFTSVSLRHEGVGKLKLVGVQGHRAHIRVFTLGALKELLVLHNLEIVKLEGWEIGTLDAYLKSRLLGWIVEPIDKFFTKFPSLASRIAVVVKRGTV